MTDAAPPTEITTFDLADAGPVECYQLITRVVGPRPIALVSSIGAHGRGNLAPFSYFMMGGANPPSCVICPVNTRDAAPKDTLRNIQHSGEYVINVCTRGFVEAMNQCSYPYERQVDEFDQSGLTRLPSQMVAPPRVAQSPVQLECRKFQIVEHGDGPLSSNYIIGQILCVHVARDVLGADGLPDNARLDLVGRLGADYYTHVNKGSLFELGRPARE